MRFAKMNPGAASRVLNRNAVSGVAEAATGPREMPTVSSLADLLSKLEKLQGRDPELFQDVMEDMAERLDQMVTTAGDGEALRLRELAERFAAAGDTGDLSVVSASKLLRAGPPPRFADEEAGPAGSVEERERRVDVAELLACVLAETGAASES